MYVAWVCKAAVCLIVLLAACATCAQDDRRNWAGREEYELASRGFQDPDPMEQLDALFEWEEKYPNSEYAPERLEAMLAVFEQINKEAAKAMAPGVLQSSRKKADPKYREALRKLMVRIVILAPSFRSPTEQQIDIIHKAANIVLSELSKPLNASKFPPEAKAAADLALAMKPAKLRATK
jgi:hypothetical protein